MIYSKKISTFQINLTWFWWSLSRRIPKFLRLKSPSSPGLVKFARVLWWACNQENDAAAYCLFFRLLGLPSSRFHPRSLSGTVHKQNFAPPSKQACKLRGCFGRAYICVYFALLPCSGGLTEFMDRSLRFIDCHMNCIFIILKSNVVIFFLFYVYRDLKTAHLRPSPLPWLPAKKQSGWMDVT